MANPAKFPEANTRYTAPGCGDLPACRTTDQSGAPMIVSRWQFTPEELEEIQRTGGVYLLLWSTSQPPVSVLGRSPFVVQPTDN